MNRSWRGGLLGIALMTIGLVLAGCSSGKGDGEASSTPAAASSSAAESTEATSEKQAEPAAAPGSLDDYFARNNIERTYAHRGDPGVPAINLPTPVDWQQVPAADLPPEAWGAITYAGADAGANPPSIIASLSKLVGEVNQQELLDVSTKESTNIEGFEPLGEPRPATLGGFEALNRAGTVNRAGGVMMLGANSVFIPAGDAAYLLELIATGPEEQMLPLSDAMNQIDAETTITV